MMQPQVTTNPIIIFIVGPHLNVASYDELGELPCVRLFDGPANVLFALSASHKPSPAG
jgi:hypothetical protein